MQKGKGYNYYYRPLAGESIRRRPGHGVLLVGIALCIWFLIVLGVVLALDISLGKLGW